ncbi:regulatory protein GemA [Rhodopseudomonas sp.]|uniref:regulatory protein GemA n=1 Tax=Rhodopseudomonas sp. TaxID=1078 RepID=UPI003B3A597D
MKPSTHRATTSMIATIHTLKGRAKLDDDSYRDLLEQFGGQRSAKDLSITEAGRVIDRLRELTGDHGIKGAVAGLDSPIGTKLRALWIAAYDLGIVRDRTDRAMLAFVQRQTGVAHTRFLQDSSAGAAAVDGLRAWLERAAGVDWPSDRRDVIAAKRAVLNAQWLRLVALNAVHPFIASRPLEDLDSYAFKVGGANGWPYLDGPKLDEVQKALGRKLRRAIEQNPESTTTTTQEET